MSPSTAYVGRGEATAEARAPSTVPSLWVPDGIGAVAKSSKLTATQGPQRLACASRTETNSEFGEKNSAMVELRDSESLLHPRYFSCPARCSADK